MGWTGYQRIAELKGKVIAMPPAEATAIADIRRVSARSAMTPTINAMVAAGLVSLPGMMTGQILAGNLPMEAVKYQILVMFIISAGAGFGALIAVCIGARRLFDFATRPEPFPTA